MRICGDLPLFDVTINLFHHSTIVDLREPVLPLAGSTEMQGPPTKSFFPMMGRGGIVFHMVLEAIMVAQMFSGHIGGSF